MELHMITGEFSVCQVEDLNAVDLTCPFTFLAATDEEISLVMPTKAMPEVTLSREDGWRMFRVQGVLDFSLIGILSRISSILAEEKIGIFVLSTFNTDYIMVKQENLPRAAEALQQEGYTFV